MKKYVFSLCLIILTLLFVSCKSSKEATEGSAEVVEIAAVNDKKSKKEEEKKSKEKNKKEEEDRGLFGWVSTHEKNPTFEDGLVKIKTDGKLGTFCIFVVDEKGKEIPVFSPLNEFSTTSFYVKAGNKKYHLQADKHVKTAAKGLDNGVVLFYTINKVCNVTVRLEVFPTVMDSPADTIKVTVEVENLSKQSEEFALKAILDTVLGERRSNHFYTYDNRPITSELASRGMKDLYYLTSKNEKASMQLLFDGGDTTPPSFFALAGFSRLEGSDWEPNMHTLGAFDTVLSYNNSAVCAIWPEVKIPSGKTNKTVFYLSVALYEDVPNGYRYVYGLGEPEEVVVEEKPLLLPPKKKTVVKKEKQPDPFIDFESKAPSKKEEVVEEEVGAVEFDVKNIKKEHLTLEYVQSLTNRIAELEASGAQLNRAEILQLNAELDAILTILKK